MKVRIGIGVGAFPLPDHLGFARLVDDLDELDFDSVWLPEILTAPTIIRSPHWPSPPLTIPG